MRYAEGLVGGDGDAVVLLAPGQNREEELGTAAVEFHVAESVDAEQADAAATGDRLVPLLLAGRLDQLVHPRGSQGAGARRYVR